MKSIRIKAIITILLITVALSEITKKRSKKNEMYVDSSLLSLIKAKITPTNGGNWADGFVCPSIQIKSNQGGNWVDQGKAVIKGKEFVEGKGLNLHGLVLEFLAPIPPNSFTSKVSIPSKKLNQIYIPWRYFNQRDCKFNNPYFNNKHIECTVTNDEGNRHTIRINFPYAYTTTYVSDPEGQMIKDKINQTGQFVSEKIVDAKNYLRMKFPLYLESHKTIENIQKGKADIKNKISQNQARIEVIKNQNVDHQKDVDALNLIYSKIYKTFKDAKSQLDKLEKDIAESNVLVKSLSDSINVLEKSKAEPQIQLESVKKLQETSKKNAEVEFNKLLLFASEQMTAINKSKAAYFNGNTAEYKLNMEKFVPKY